MRVVFVVLCSVVLVGCGDTPTIIDASVDAAVDAMTDAAPDARPDAAPDAAIDAGIDAVEIDADTVTFCQDHEDCDAGECCANHTICVPGSVLFGLCFPDN
jgi:hypothetical protein